MRACELLRTAGIAVSQVLTDTRALAFVVPRHQRLPAVRELHAALISTRAKADATAP
jgi:hypothetical protein